MAVLSTVPTNGYTWKTGTSMACPHVSGAAALLRQVNPALTVEEVKTALMVTATDLGPTGPDNGYGWGLLNVGAAVDWVLQNHPPLPAPKRLTATLVDTFSVRLAWSTPLASAQGDTLVGYRIYRALGTELYTTSALDSVAAPDSVYLDVRPAPGNYRYRVTALYAGGGESAPSNEVRANVIDPSSGVISPDGPAESLTVSIRPNPARSVIEFSIPAADREPVTLDLFDASGRRAFTATSGAVQGTVRFLWDGRDTSGERLASGAYFALVRAGGRKTTGRLVLLP
jgi:subtilisin family serine protease